MNSQNKTQIMSEIKNMLDALKEQISDAVHQDSSNAPLTLPDSIFYTAITKYFEYFENNLTPDTRSELFKKLHEIDRQVVKTLHPLHSVTGDKREEAKKEYKNLVTMVDNF